MTPQAERETTSTMLSDKAATSRPGVAPGGKVAPADHTPVGIVPNAPRWPLYVFALLWLVGLGFLLVMALGSHGPGI